MLDHPSPFLHDRMVSADGADDLATMGRVKTAFDPAGLANPGKIFPTPGRCREFQFAARR